MINVANASRNVANAFENNFSVLESVSNRLKYVVMRCQCILNAFLTYLLCQVFTNGVTNHLLATSFGRMVVTTELDVVTVGVGNVTKCFTLPTNFLICFSLKSFFW